MSEHDVICTGAEECKKLVGATHVFWYGDKEIIQRPEHCSSRNPHLPSADEDKSFICPHINKRVEAKRIWQRAGV